MSTVPPPEVVLDDDASSVVENNPRALAELELFWRDHQKWLAEKGYMLRPRYRPEWVPSWGPEDDHFDFEDGLWNRVSHTN